MLDRKSLLNLLLTAAVVVFFFVLDRVSISGFETKLSVGLCLTLLLVIWSKWLSVHRARLTASYPCLAGFYFVLFLVERGPNDFGTQIGGVMFLIGLVGFIYILRTKAEPDEDEAD
ncbi:MAG: hypothetical protein ABR991_09830 [Terracidiphilus sp.]|jgi:hypothetical protein